MEQAVKCTCGQRDFCMQDCNLKDRISTEEEISQSLFKIHTHPDMMDCEPGTLEVVYRHDDIIELFKKLGYNL